MEVNPTVIDNNIQVSQEQFWQEQMKLKLASGLSRSAYCRKHNLICSRFAYWEKKLSQSTCSKLLPVKLDLAVKPNVLCSLVLKNGDELRIHDQLVLPTVLALLR